MKTTLEISDPLFRKVKATAAQQGRTMKEFFTEALTEKLAAVKSKGKTTGWREALQKMSPKTKAAARAVHASLQSADFNKIDEEMWR